MAKRIGLKASQSAIILHADIFDFPADASAIYQLVSIGFSSHALGFVNEGDGLGGMNGRRGGIVSFCSKYVKFRR